MITEFNIDGLNEFNMAFQYKETVYNNKLYVRTMDISELLINLPTDIVNMINMIERVQAPNCKHEIIDTKFLRQEGDHYLEEWKVLSCGKEIIYPVKLIPSPSGGTDFGVRTPNKGDR